jgi:NaMN:DMB phosphoribosyltransferase
MVVVSAIAGIVASAAAAMIAGARMNLEKVFLIGVSSCYEDHSSDRQK